MAKKFILVIEFDVGLQDSEWSRRVPIPENIKLVEATEATAIETSPALKYG